jgi:hypothetical protein
MKPPTVGQLDDRKPRVRQLEDPEFAPTVRVVMELDPVKGDNDSLQKVP